MNKKNTSKSALFLIELIFCIFFFIIAMAICLQLFVKAHTISNDTIAINHALLWTQNLSELFLGSNGDYSVVQDAYADWNCTGPTLLNDENHILLLFDKNWEPVTESAKAFYMVLSEYSKDDSFAYQDIYTANLTMTDDIRWETDTQLLACTPDTLIHHIQIKKYLR